VPPALREFPPRVGFSAVHLVFLCFDCSDLIYDVLQLERTCLKLIYYPQLEIQLFASGRAANYDRDCDINTAFSISGSLQKKSRSPDWAAS
jgi:hypothetical protein